MSKPTRFNAKRLQRVPQSPGLGGVPTASVMNSFASLLSAFTPKGKAVAAQTSVKGTEEIREIGDAREINDLIPYSSNKPCYLSSWSSPTAFVDYLQNTPYWDDTGREGQREQWSGNVTFDEACELARIGWPEGAKKADGLRRSILANNPVGPKYIKYGISGAYPNVPRAIAGNPLNMRNIDLVKSRKKPVLTLIANMAAYGCVDPESVTRRASVCAAIIDQIESMGFACEVIASAFSEGYCSGKNKNLYTNIVVKNSNQPVDTGKLAFGLGHASMFRKLIFADRCTDPWLKDVGTGWSSRVYPTEGLKEKGIFVLPSANDNEEAFESDEKAEKEGLPWLTNCLKEQGCPAFAG